jgi:hypothetical protein
MGIRIGIALAGLLGGLLLLAAELTTLYAVRAGPGDRALDSVNTGTHHGYALVPIGVLAALLSFGFWLTRSRAALLALGGLGLIALLIALLGDLPDARASGVVGNGAARFVHASAHPSAGLYIETLGAAVLLITCGIGLLLLPPGSSPQT